MPTKTCPQCHGSGNTIGVKSGGILYENTRQNCPNCWGTGSVEVNDPAPPRAKKPVRTPEGHNGTTKADSEQQARGVLALIGFLAGSICTYQQISEDVIWAGIAGLVGCGIVWKWYKAIIIIGVIVGIIYLFVELNTPVEMKLK